MNSYGKVHVNVSLDSGVVFMAKEKGINISSVCENAIREILGSFEKQTLPSECEHKFTWAFAVPSGLARECVKCGMFQRVELVKK